MTISLIFKLFSKHFPKTYSFNNLSYSFNELIELENKYIKDLQFVIENYLQELSRIDCAKQIKEKRDFIFSNIEDIFAFHKV